MEEIAAAEKFNASYVGRIVRLTLLVPDIVEAILDARQPTDIVFVRLLSGFPIEWEKQRQLFGPKRGEQQSTYSP